MTKKYDAFISYAHQDSEFVRRLSDRLMENGFTIFFAERDIAAGAELAESLNRAVVDAKYVLVIMSQAYFRSRWAKMEWQLALNEEVNQPKPKVIPLLIEDCEIPAMLATKVYADFRTEEAFNQAFPQLATILREDPTVPEQPTGLRLERTIGSVSPDLQDSAELRSMVEELKAKVEAFVEKTEPETKKVEQIRERTDDRLCFVVMPFGPEELNDVYEYFVKPSVEANCSLRCERGDDVFGSNVVMEDIRRSISRARIVLADLTGRNPNVFYEVGIAHTLDKEVLLLSQAMDDVPFDLRHRRVLVYDNTPKGCKKLEQRVAENVNAILAGGT